MTMNSNGNVGIGIRGKFTFFSKSLNFFKKSWHFLKNVPCFQEFFQKWFGEAKTIWRSSEEIVTGTPLTEYMFQSLFLEGTQRGVFTVLIYNEVSRIYNEVSRGQSTIMQIIQVTIHGQSGGMRAANHNTCNGNNALL